SDSNETLSDGNERTISSDELESSGSEGNDSLIEELNQSSMDYWEWKVGNSNFESISNDADPTTTTDDKELIPKWFEPASSMIVETKPVELQESLEMIYFNQHQYQNILKVDFYFGIILVQ
ncbi:unnamed protein product, partial [Adineta steineri]